MEVKNESKDNHQHVELPADFAEQVRQARAAYTEMVSSNLAAVSVKYDQIRKRVDIKLENKDFVSSPADLIEISIPADLIEGLANASDDDRAGVHLSESGYSVHWEKLDLDFSVTGLVNGIYGTQAWMEKLKEQNNAK